LSLSFSSSSESESESLELSDPEASFLLFFLGDLGLAAFFLATFLRFFAT
jgi:hypothetical protein